MKSSQRFIQSAIRAAQDDKTAFPWQRGARRADAIAARKGTAPKLKSA